ncbi:hypothetical protein QR680_011406 [Steinernema hermaphroditum]|uniref:Uncharacterized protein n=1 Tax=Steinernema hermaphroditum TaxID=289476 RepID=A0AA39IV18_9BILA|nr:hypothetical protein QR680_011406 [Steinernema hermaphroditum]
MRPLCNRSAELFIHHVNAPATDRVRGCESNVPFESVGLFFCIPHLSSDSIRNVRTNITHDESKKNGRQEHEDTKQHEEKAEEWKTGGESGGSGSQPPRMTPELAKKLRIYSIIVTLMSFVVTYAALRRFTSDGAEERSLVDDLKSEPISMNEFLDKYLSSGEVKRITYMPMQNKAAAWMQDDAVIDGKPCPHKVVLIDYKRVEGQPTEQFTMEVRHAEEKLGIPMSDGIEIQVVQGFSAFRLAELLIGLTIIVLLASQYGRLIRRKMMEQQAQAAKAGKKPPTL